MKFIFIILFFFGLSGCFWLPSGKVSRFKDNYVPKDWLSYGKIKATYCGTSTLIFEDEDDQIIMDGFFSRPSILNVAFGKIQCDTNIVKKMVQKYSLNKLRAIWVCHSHYDHCMDAPYLARLTGATIYGSSSTLNVARGYGIRESQLKEFQPNDTYIIGNFTIKVLASLHTPSFQFLGFSNDNSQDIFINQLLKQPAKYHDFKEGGTFDFYIQNQNIQWMVKASTNFIPDFLKNYTVDYYFLGIASLGKMQKEFQEKYYQETIQMTQPKYVIPIHWDNFMKPIHKPFVPLSRIADRFNRSMNFLLNKSLEDNFQVIIIPEVKTFYMK